MIKRRTRRNRGGNSKSRVKLPEKISKVTVIAGIYSSVLDELEATFDLGGGDNNGDKLSSGSLVTDLVSGGGLLAGMTTLFGPEQSAKSTQALTALRSAMQAQIPIIEHHDAEGTTTSDPNYAAAILRVKSLKEVYGQKVDGKWIITPKVRYYDNTVLESTYGAMRFTINRIPDKIYLQSRKSWFLRIAANDKKLAKFLKAGDIDESLSSDKRFVWISTDNPYPQAFIAIDSYPTLLPESLEERDEDDSSEAMAAQALAYAKALRRVAGKFRRKQIIVLGVNQLRERPGVMFGPSTYEPCGNALKLYSSVRDEFNSRVVPKEWRNKGTAKYSEESSVEGNGVDRYAYKYVRNIKNKLGTPWMEGWLRIWIRDSKGSGRGIDPVFDTAFFLQTIGLAKIQGNFNTIKFSSHMQHPALAGKQLKWAEFKTGILADDYPGGKLVASKQMHGLRAWCFVLLNSGQVASLMLENLREDKATKRTKI